MGLGGRKQKQRIPEDPRNQKWANDSSRTSFKLLTGMGWTSTSEVLNPSGRRHGNSYKRRALVPTARSHDHANLGIGATPGQSITYGGLWDTSGRVRLYGLIEGMGWIKGRGLKSTMSGEVYEVNQVKIVKGGEFGRILERLNKKRKVEEVEDVQNLNGDSETKEKNKSEEPPRKKKKKESKSVNKHSNIEQSEKDSSKKTLIDPKSAYPTPPDSHQPSPRPTSDILSSVPPRISNISRHRNLRAKREAARDSNAMREILGLPPLPLKEEPQNKERTTETVSMQVDVDTQEVIEPIKEGEKEMKKEKKDKQDEKEREEEEEGEKFEGKNKVVDEKSKKEERKKEKKEKKRKLKDAEIESEVKVEIPGEHKPTEEKRKPVDEGKKSEAALKKRRKQEKENDDAHASREKKSKKRKSEAS